MGVGEDQIGVPARNVPMPIGLPDIWAIAARFGLPMPVPGVNLAPKSRSSGGLG
jgi:hypothetical protein